MGRLFAALVAALLLAGALAIPAVAARPAQMDVSVTGPTSGCSGIVVSASWDRPKRGQALLTLYLRDETSSYERWVQFAVDPTATSGSATFTIDTSPGYTGRLSGFGYLNRSFSDPHKPYANLLLAVSTPPLPVAGCSILTSN